MGGKSGSNPRRANGHRRDMTVKWLRSQRRPCWICVAFGKSGAIDYSLPAGHPYAFECDELVPVSLGGSPFSRSNADATQRSIDVMAAFVSGVLRVLPASSWFRQRREKQRVMRTYACGGSQSEKSKEFVRTPGGKGASPPN